MESLRRTFLQKTPTLELMLKHCLSDTGSSSLPNDEKSSLLFSTCPLGESKKYIDCKWKLASRAKCIIHCSACENSRTLRQSVPTQEFLKSKIGTLALQNNYFTSTFSLILCLLLILLVESYFLTSAKSYPRSFGFHSLSILPYASNGMTSG